MRCNICLTELRETIYESHRSLTSLCEISPDPTIVRTCARCGHIQTDTVTDAESYYDEEYTILTDCEEEDQIYEIRDSQTVYRTDHQVDVLLDKIDLPSGVRILDFGCAKSSTMRTLQKTRPDIGVHLYDISDRYLPFWDKFAEPENVAVYDLPACWEGYFDIVTSFFSLEHITHPLEVTQSIVRLLKPGGVFYGVVPNVFTNTADLIVIDHANHFTPSSLTHLLSKAGLDVIDIDATCHRGAYVWKATKSADAQKPVPTNVDVCNEDIVEIASFWSRAASRIRDFESMVPEKAGIAIYGAGFYGTFIHTSLQTPANVQYFVDQNEFLQGKQLHSAPIVAPQNLPPTVDYMLVGLNPAHAREIIAGVPALATRKLNCFFL